MENKSEDIVGEEEGEKVDEVEKVEKQEVTVKDKLMRDHIPTPGPGSGKLYEFFTAAEVTPSNIGEHVNHLKVVRQLEKIRTGKDKRILVLIVDQGSGAVLSLDAMMSLDAFMSSDALMS